jgi:predicted nucleic acid-binding protein
MASSKDSRGTGRCAQEAIPELLDNVHICRDPKDDMFLECAALAGADVLVTGDKDLLSLGTYGSTKIITPLEYVAMP